MNKDRIIMGIDPGTNIMGYGIIQITGNEISLISMGSILLSKLKDPYLKLGKIYDRTFALIEQYMPDELAIEAPFYGKNVQSMLKLGRAQGVSIAAALAHELPITEYMPKKIKMSVTGNGNASKEQVAAMLATIVKYKEVPTHLDATDGLAVAVCHYLQGGAHKSEGKKYNSWGNFLKDNPNRKVS